LGELFPFFLGPLVGLLCIYTYYYYKNFFFLAWIIYSLVPWIDYLTPVDHFNLPEHKVRLYEKDKRFLIPLYTLWSMDFIFFYWILYDVYQGKVGTNNLNFIVLAFCIA